MSSASVTDADATDPDLQASRSSGSASARTDGGPRPRPGRPANPTVRRLSRERNAVKKAFGVLGPGFITGASDDDPSGIGTYAQAGAQYGYATLWATVAMLPMMSAIQYICAKIGMVSGRGLAGVLRASYPREIMYPAVIAMVVANTVNAGADIGAIAAAINLFVPIPPVVFVIPVTVAILALQLFASYAVIARVFKWLTLALLAYIGAAVFARPDAGQVLAGTLLPTIHFDSQFVAILVALLGTTISPYLFFWQASHEVEAEVEMGRHRLWEREGATKSELRYAFWDTLAGMAFSELVAYFIILATAATLHAHGTTNIGSATDAAKALEPIAGQAASLLLAIGLIGAGTLAVPVLTGAAAYGVAETFGWKSGLDRKVGRAPEFYAVIVVASVVGMLINFLGINPITALVVSAVINGLLAPPLLALVMLIANDRAVMGARTNGRWLNAVGWATTATMAVAAVALVVTTIAG